MSPETCEYRVESVGGETQSDDEQMEVEVFLENVVTGSDRPQKEENSKLN
jgi:hypothetical protein